MRYTLSTVLLIAGVTVTATPQSPLTVGSLPVAPATTIAEIDTDKMKGQPSRLAWSPDGSELYVQMMEGPFGKPGVKLSHHLIKVAGGERREVAAEPEWVASYWTAKSGQASPDDAAVKIDLKTENRSQRTVSAPMGGDLAKGGGAGGDGGVASAGDAMAAAYNQQAVPVHTMRLHGEVIGEYVNSVIVPGQTFGWGPKGSKVIAYSANKSGRVVVMDAKGTKQELQGTQDSSFPSWSQDGARLAWLQKDGRKKYQIRVAKIG